MAERLRTIDSLMLEAGAHPLWRVRIDDRYGSHMLLPKDVRQYRFIIGEDPRGPGLYREGTDTENIAHEILGGTPYRWDERVIKSSGNSVSNKTNEEEEEEKNSLFGYTPLGIGSSNSEELKDSVKDALKLRTPGLIRLDEIGMNYLPRQFDLVNSVTVAELGFFYACFRIAGQYGFKTLKRIIESLVDNHTKDDSPRKLTRRSFFKGLTASTAFVLARESLILRGAIEGVTRLNDAAIDTDILGRRQISGTMSGIMHGVAYGVPETVLKTMGDKRGYYGYFAHLSLRDLNMAMGTYAAAVALSYSEKRRAEPLKDVLAWYGIAHVGIKSLLEKGNSHLAKRARDFSLELINDFTNWIAREPENGEKRLLLSDFLHVASKFSHPISGINLKLSGDAKLPETGISMLWRSMAEYSRLVGKEPSPKRAAFESLYNGLGRMHQQLIEKYANQIDMETAATKGVYGHNHVWTFSPKRSFDLLLPREVESGVNGGEIGRRRYVIAIQNGNVFAFPLIRTGPIGTIKTRIKDSEELGIYSRDEHGYPRWHFYDSSFEKNGRKIFV